MSETVTRREPAYNEPVAQRDITEPVDIAPPLGIIGLGPQGQAVALALLRAGLRPLACDTDPARCRAYAEAAGPDADLTDSPAEVARRCTLVLLVLDLGHDTATVHNVLQHRLPTGSLIVDMGPALPGNLRRLDAELAAQGLHLIDAPLLPGDPPIVLAGGSEADRALALPVLQVLGTVVATGPIGSAQALAALIAELDEVPNLARIRALAAQ
jgi:3-hydroxyisobutyrate dehydrogenase-like beta-hydroxyacid dehydrogenase